MSWRSPVLPRKDHSIGRTGLRTPHSGQGEQCCAMERDCALEDSSTPATELEHHTWVCPVLPVSRRMLQAPFPFFTLPISSMGIKGQETRKEKGFTKDDTPSCRA